MSKKMQRYTVYFIWKLLYMFRVVPPPIIRSANNCIYSICWFVIPLLLPAAIAAGSTIIYTNVHENPYYDREDTEIKVIYSLRKVPFITGQTQAKITTINTRACTVWDIMFHENRCHDSPRHRPKGTSISMKSALYYWPFATKFITINVYVCSVNETKLQENRPCESLVTGQNVFSPLCKVPFIADQSQPKMQQLTSMRVQCDVRFQENRWYDSQDTDEEMLGSLHKAAFLIDQSQPNLHFVLMRVQCAIRIFMKIVLFAAEIDQKVLSPPCKLALFFFLTNCNQA